MRERITVNTNKFDYCLTVIALIPYRCANSIWRICVPPPARIAIHDSESRKSIVAAVSHETKHKSCSPEFYISSLDIEEQRFINSNLYNIDV